VLENGEAAVSTGKIALLVFKTLYKPLIRRSARQVLEGRFFDDNDKEKGRFLRDDIDTVLRTTWCNVDELLPRAGLETLPTTGNRHNVFLAVLTTAAYRALIEFGLTRAYAASLIGDVGWKLYALGIKVVSWPFRISTRDSGKRIERTIKVLMIFPFSAPGRPGYEVKITKQTGQLLTHWTWCPPQAFVRDLVRREGDKGELDAFYNSWCLYDWPGADLMAGDGERGHYTRTRTLSKGDKVCDMCWKFKGNGQQ